MKTIELVILVGVLVARLCRSEVVIESLTPDQATSVLVEDLVTIVTSCYGDRIHDGIGLAGDLPDTLLRSLWSRRPIPVVLIDNSTKMEGLPSWVPMEIRHKLPIFVVGPSSAEELGDIIQLRIKYSIWWDHMASFIILDRSVKCDKIVQYLDIAWQLGLLNAKVMCYSIARIIAIHNPFTSSAPFPWRKLISYRSENGHPLTIFYQQLRKDETICVNLDVERVNDCGGYPIKVKGVPLRSQTHYHNERFKHRRNYLLTLENTLYPVYRLLNVKPRYLNEKTRDDEDMALYPITIHNSWNHRLVSYPYMHSGFVILSQFKGNKSQLQKILDVIDRNSHIGLCVTYLVTLIFFKFVVGQSLMPAILNLMRITCGAGFEHLPRSDALRIYLAGILFVAVTMHGIFDGNLASLLTTVIPLRNVNTMQDLVDFDYTLYGTSTHERPLLDTEIQKRFIVAEPAGDCVLNVVEDKSSGCLLSATGGTFDIAKLYNLHVSEKVITCYHVFSIRMHWPLEERFNILLSRLFEADVLEPWHIKCDPIKFEDYRFDNDVKQNKVFKNIELGELRFAFTILGIGLFLATVTFVAELGIYYEYSCTCRIVMERLSIRD